MSTTTVTWKIVCHWLLAPPMPLQCSLKYSPCFTEWIDVYYKHTDLWKYLNIMEPFIHDKHTRQKIHADWKQPTL